jgi:hypothetical protein
MVCRIIKLRMTEEERMFWLRVRVG